MIAERTKIAHGRNIAWQEQRMALCAWVRRLLIA
jgi:hypothetical protein